MDHNFAQCTFMLDDRQLFTVPHLLDLAPYQPSAANNCLQHPILHRFLDWSLPTNPPAQWVHSQAWFPSKICSFWPQNETIDQEPLPSASFQKWALLAFCSIVIWGAQAPKAYISPGCLTTCNFETHNNFCQGKTWSKIQDLLTKGKQNNKIFANQLGTEPHLCIGINKNSLSIIASAFFWAEVTIDTIAIQKVWCYIWQEDVPYVSSPIENWIQLHLLANFTLKCWTEVLNENRKPCQRDAVHWCSTSVHHGTHTLMLHIVMPQIGPLKIVYWDWLTAGWRLTEMQHFLIRLTN